MNNGFVKIACASPKVKVAGCEHNSKAVCLMAKKAAENGAKIIVFPELVITGYTCQDLFLHESILSESESCLVDVMNETKDIDALIFVGMPFEYNSKLFNVAAVIFRGELLGIVPKKNMPNYGEYYEMRHFYPGNNKAHTVIFNGKEVPFGTDIIFEETSTTLPLRVACELCEDLWTMDPPSTNHAKHGATLIVNLSASNEIVCKDDYRKSLVSMTSARLVAAYAYASAGDGESTQDLVFSGHSIIAENGSILSESALFESDIIYADVDFAKISGERRRMTTYPLSDDNDDYRRVCFSLKMEETKLSRTFSDSPFVPKDSAGREKRCEEILEIQARGLKKRLEHIHCSNVVVGLSGGLDSTLALLVITRAFDILDLDRKGIHCITMPCFGTTDRTYDNACKLADAARATLKEIKLMDSVRLHFKDIGHDESVHDVTYENGQARERTQVLMDMANKVNGIVIGTGDMSELALGWATYNGDHMSMYGVNAGVPKTLVRHLVRYYADKCQDETLKAVLYDVLDTPVSPELLPPEKGEISQKTEDLVGPYSLHDFFLYYTLRFGFSPAKIFRLALIAFEGEYDRNTILKWEKTFFRRFFAQHFKRSCLPDGPKVGTVAVSPRGDLRMPSDADSTLWLAELDGLD